MKSPANERVRDCLHQLAHFAFQKIIHHDQGPDRVPHVTAARRYSVIDGGLKIVSSPWLWLWAGVHNRCSVLTVGSGCSHYVLVESSTPKRRFPPSWRVEQADADCYVVRDANGFKLATVHCRDDLQKWSFGHSHLTSDEARRIAYAFARLPEFLMQRQGFYKRGSGERWKPACPYHVALEDSYIRAHWDEIDALCKLNSLPFNATGEKIQGGGLWCVYQFTWQLDAMQFWDRFEGRWLLGSEFHYPERPKDLPPMKPLVGRPKFDPKRAR